MNKLSYTRHTWVDDESITYQKLNNIEDGVEEAAESGGGYDAEISIYHSDNSSDDYELTILSGSYNDLKEKLYNNEPPVVLAKIWDELSHYKGATTMISIYSYPRVEYPSNSFVFTVKMPSSSASSHTSWFGLPIEWTSNDELQIW